MTDQEEMIMACELGLTCIVKQLVEKGVDFRANNDLAVKTAFANNQKEILDYFKMLVMKKELSLLY